MSKTSKNNDKKSSKKSGSASKKHQSKLRSSGEPKKKKFKTELMDEENELETKITEISSNSYLEQRQNSDGRMMVLIIMDGYGISLEKESNAVYHAETPVLDKLYAKCPNAELDASGLAVGLPAGQMGNSEVGHTNVGAGRVVYQDLTRITKSIQEGDFFEKQELLDAIANCKKNTSALHLMGLLSDGGVHSHIEHLYALLTFAKKKKIAKVFIHCFLDGRDTPPKSAKKYIEELERKIQEVGVGVISTVSGRYYAMDRDNRWDRVEKSYLAMFKGKSNRKFETAMEVVEESYKLGITDEFVIPSVIFKGNSPVTTIKANDSIIFFNFRPDRSRQIVRAIAEPSFNKFKRDFVSTYFVSMTQYQESIANVKIVFKPNKIAKSLGECISKNNIRQLRIAETEKYAHVTFFFNGGSEKIYEGEDRVMINSPKVSTYDIQPGMSAYELTDETCNRIRSRRYGLIVLNFANCDMVGHTGNFAAATLAVEAVDFCLGKILNAVKSVGGIAVITADHGNAEKMFDKSTNEPFTSHTTNRVPLIIYGKNGIKLSPGKLSDVAPTILELMEIEQPEEMTARSLIIE